MDVSSGIVIVVVIVREHVPGPVDSVAAVRRPLTRASRPATGDESCAARSAIAASVRLSHCPQTADLTRCDSGRLDSFVDANENASSPLLSNHSVVARG